MDKFYLVVLENDNAQANIVRLGQEEYQQIMEGDESDVEAVAARHAIRFSSGYDWMIAENIHINI